MTPPTHKEFIDKIEKEGYNQIDEGGYAEVYAKGQQIYKVYPDYSGYQDEKTIKGFAEYCERHSSNRNLQKVFEFQDNGKWAYIRSPLYKKISKSDWDHDKTLLGLRDYTEKEAQGLFVHPSFPQAVNDEVNYKQFKTTNLYRTLEDIKRKFYRSTHKIDFNKSNFMYAPGKTVVVIDI